LLKKYYSLPHYETVPEVHSVLLCYDVREYVHVKEEIERLIKEVCNSFFVVVYYSTSSFDSYQIKKKLML
jgi:hypothetical protein